MKRMVTIAVWLLLATALLGLMTTQQTGIRMATGANSYTGYGWPLPWLVRNQFQTFVGHGDGPLVRDQYWVKWHVSSWSGAVTSALAALTIAGCVVGVPLLLRKRIKEGANQASQPIAGKPGSG